MENGIVCYFDGACEPFNPGGAMGIGACIFLDGKEIEKYSHGVDVNVANSNNVAEYMGFEWLLITLKEKGWNNRVIRINGDSQLVIQQMKGVWGIKSGRYVPYAQRCKELMQVFPNTILQWISREKNHYADELSKAELIKCGVELKIQPTDESSAW